MTSARRERDECKYFIPPNRNMDKIGLGIWHVESTDFFNVFKQGAFATIRCRHFFTLSHNFIFQLLLNSSEKQWLVRKQFYCKITVGFCIPYSKMFVNVTLFASVRRNVWLILFLMPYLLNLWLLYQLP